MALHIYKTTHTWSGRYGLYKNKMFPLESNVRMLTTSPLSAACWRFYREKLVCPTHFISVPWDWDLWSLVVRETQWSLFLLKSFDYPISMKFLNFVVLTNDLSQNSFWAKNTSPTPKGFSSVSVNLHLIKKKLKNGCYYENDEQKSFILSISIFRC